jgi:predicted GNAT family acetyltransferase
MRRDMFATALMDTIAIGATKAGARWRWRQLAVTAARMSSASYAVRDNVEKHRFEIDLGDGSIAIAQYTLRPGKITFTHTEVPPAHEGKGVGSAMIQFALASARERGLKVVPICPFFAAFIADHPEEQDLLDPSYRKILKLN